MALFIPAVVTMIAAQLLDLVTFVTMVHRLGPTAEANPLVQGLLRDYGVPMAAVAKVALIAFVVAIAAVLSARTARSERLIGAVVVAAAIIGGILGGGTNALTMGPL